MKSIVKLIGSVLGVGFAVSFFFRLLFLFLFKDPNQSLEFQKVFFVFFHGLRFDLSALLYLNVLFLLFLCFKRVREHSIFLNLLAVSNALYLFLFIGDLYYYSVYGNRADMNFATTFKGVDPKLFLRMSLEFAGPIVILAVVLVLLRILFKCLFKVVDFDLELKKYPLYLLVILILGFLGVRGGLQKRVLGPQHTWIFSGGDSFYAQLTSNTLHNLIRTKKGNPLPKRYTGLKASSLPSWSEETHLSAPVLGRAPKNVLFVFVESLSSYSYEKGHLPEFGKWIGRNQEDLFFTTDFHANGILSKDALFSVFFGIPSYFNIHFFDSKYATNHLHGIGQVAKKLDLESFFLHAAPFGTQFFDAITKASGFGKYISVYSDYKGDKKMKGTWGIHDERFYKESLSYMDQRKKGFLGALFTTSSHFPFKGTPNNKNGTGSLEKDYFLSIEYADKSLIEFFKEAQTRPWFKDTLIVVTGDHSPPLGVDWNKKTSESSRVPALLYWEGSGLSRLKINKLGRHVDLPKTLYDFLGASPDKWTPYGQSLINQNAKNFKKQVFYTDSGKLNIALGEQKFITKPYYIKSDDFKAYDGKLSKPDEADFLKDSKGEVLEKFKASENEIKDYLYRLEKNVLYQ